MKMLIEMLMEMLVLSTVEWAGGDPRNLEALAAHAAGRIPKRLASARVNGRE